ncbi:MAG: hypothetical protein WCE75_11735 [Terracidiphilus sp.]
MNPRIVYVALVALALSPAGALAQQPAQEKKPAESAEMKHIAAPSSPEWQQLRTLVGQWQASGEEGGQKVESTLEVRMTGGGSAIMHVLDKDGPYEMVTMFHPDGPALLATHYCASHNQPRMQMVPAPGPNQIAFRFKDGTNIGPGDGHMVGLVITFIDANHHDEAWIYEDKGKEMPASVFHFSRKP